MCKYIHLKIYKYIYVGIISIYLGKKYIDICVLKIKKILRGNILLIKVVYIFLIYDEYIKKLLSLLYIIGYIWFHITENIFKNIIAYTFSRADEPFFMLSFYRILFLFRAYLEERIASICHRSWFPLCPWHRISAATSDWQSRCPDFLKKIIQNYHQLIVQFLRNY